MKPPTRSCQPAPSDRQDQAVQDLCARALRGGQQASPTSGCPLRWNKPCSSASRLEFFHQGLWLQGKGCAQGPHTCRLGRSRCRGRPQPTRRAGSRPPGLGAGSGRRAASACLPRAEGVTRVHTALRLTNAGSERVSRGKG